MAGYNKAINPKQPEFKVKCLSKCLKLYLFPDFFFFFTKTERGSCMVWEINMGVCPRLDFDNITLLNCLGYNFNVYGGYEILCNSIAKL